MSVVPDFGALPPEVNSGLIYAGAGAGSLDAAATAWAQLAEELSSAAHDYAAVISELAGSAWQGPAAAAMADAAAPYVGWLHDTASHAAHAAGQAAAAADAYQSAAAAMVAPAVIAANRARLAALTATNLLGHNSPAIADTEAAYAAMWAQDAAAMHSYAAHCAAAARLTPLTAAPPSTTTHGPADQAAASAAAANTPTALSHLTSTLPNLLQALTGSAGHGVNIFNPANASSSQGLSGLLNGLSGTTNSAAGDLANSELVSTIFSGGFFNPENFAADFTSFDFLIIYAFQDYVKSITGAAGGAGALGGIVSEMGSFAPAGLGGLGTLAGAHTAAAAPVSAGVGKATLVRALSVPKSWAALDAPAPALPAASSAPPPLAPTTSPVLTTAIPRAGAGRMVDKLEDDDEETPVYGFRTKALTRTPAGG